MDELNLLTESLWALILFIWVMIVVYPVTKTLYNYMAKKKIPHIKIVYYNRKVIHILAGGLVALTVPYLFETPLLPGILAAVLAIATYIPHHRNKLMYWFQTQDNMYEVHFCIMWGLTITLAWLIFNNWWYGVIPVSFMAFGDGVTGIVRNLLYNKRTKAWIGNIAMAAVTIPVGLIVLGPLGGIAGLLASIIEHFEAKPIDDNITVPLISFLTLLIGYQIV